MSDVQRIVKDKYGAVAAGGLSSHDAGVHAVAQAFGYSPDELASIPAQANMGLSCGNPTAFAGLRPGEVVVDLGCGGGLDVFLAAQKVGPTGKAIGIDMTPEMIALAERNAANGPGGRSVENVEFHLATIDRMPLPDASADVIVSNCVINLAPDKAAVFRDMFRVLKPGGRVAVSDIALKQPLPPDLARDIMAYVGCIAGAVPIDDYRRALTHAGFRDVVVLDSNSDLNAYAQVEGQSACCAPPMAATQSQDHDSRMTPRSIGLTIAKTDDGCCTTTSSKDNPTVHAGLADLLKRHNVNDYAASVKVYAIKPPH
jgi:arsenite methyltransferase